MVRGRHYQQAGPAGSYVVPFDFRRPNKFSRDHVRAFQIVHETFGAVEVALRCSPRRRACWCATRTLGTVEQLTYDEYVRSLPNPSYLIVLSLSPLPGAAILQFPLPIVFAAIDRLLGGTGELGQPEAPAHRDRVEPHAFGRRPDAARARIRCTRHSCASKPRSCSRSSTRSSRRSPDRRTWRWSCRSARGSAKKHENR